MSDQDIHNEAVLVGESMVEHGGVFQKKMGELILLATPYNAAKIKEAFPEYWDTYKVLAIRFSEDE